MRWVKGGRGGGWEGGEMGRWEVGRFMFGDGG